MANITLDARQQQKHDTSTNFNNANKLYLEGEFLVETDTGKVKIGDGTLGYKSLPYTIGTRVPEGAKFTDTTYTAGTGLSLNGTSFSISNSGVTAGSYGPSQDSSVGFGDSIDVPYISVNSRGQITSADSRSITLPSKPTPTSIGAEPAFAKNTAFNKNFGSAAGTVCQGNDSRLSNARPASDVSAWAKAPNKPTYTPTEVGVIGTAPTSGQVAVFDGTTGKIKSTGFTIASSVPSGAKFTDTTYSAATSTALGLVKVGYTESGRNYPVELDADDKMFVNVPWTDTNTTYSQATSGTLGLIKIGYAESGKNYPVELNSSGQAFVNVPWTDSIANNPTITITQNGTSKGSFTLNQTSAETIALTDTTYSTFVKSGTGAKAGLVPAPSTTAGTTKYLREDGTWTAPPNTTYANFKAATASIAGGSGLVPAPAAGKQTSYLRGDGTWAIPSQPTVNNATITVKQAGAVKGSFTLNQSGAATIELTDNNTTYSAVSTSAAGLAPKLPGNTTTFLRGDGTWSSTSFSGGTVSGATTFSSNVTVNGEFNYDGGLY